MSTPKRENFMFIYRCLKTSFEGVSFSYGKGEVLKNLSFHIPEHSTAALVGRSGSGKSTVMNLSHDFMTAGGEAFELEM